MSIYSRYTSQTEELPPPIQATPNRADSHQLKQTIQQIKIQADAAGSNIPEYTPFLLDAKVGAQHINQVQSNYYQSVSPYSSSKNIPYDAAKVNYTGNNNLQVSSFQQNSYFPNIEQTKLAPRDSFYSSVSQVDPQNNYFGQQSANTTKRADTQSVAFKLSTLAEPSLASYGNTRGQGSFAEIVPQIGSAPVVDQTAINETIHRANQAIRNSLAVVTPVNLANTQISSFKQPSATLINPINQVETNYQAFQAPSATSRSVISSASYTQHNAALEKPQQYLQTPYSIQSYGANFSSAQEQTKPNNFVAGQIKVDVFSTKWKEIIARGERDGSEFSDSEFLPSPATIGGSYKEVVEWLRPRQFIQGQKLYSIFSRYIDPTTILEGDLNDTYFRGAVAALAERDYSILKLFLTKTVNKAGCYVLNICWKGVWTPVILDDKFPVKNNNTELCFTKSSGNELWVSLLEKAWAKLHGSYAKIDGGLVREALHDLTGAPARNFFISGESSISPSETWQRIQHAEDKDLVIVVSCMEDHLTPKQAEISQLYGVGNTHSYSVLGTLCVQFESSDLRFIKLRNPNCRKEWPQGSKDMFFESLPIDLVHQLKYGGRDVQQGFFLMKYEDFVQFFSDLQICYQFQGFQYTGEKVCCVRGENSFFKIDIPQEGNYFFQLSQQSIRTEAISQQMLFADRDYYSRAYLAIAPESNPTDLVVAVTGYQRDLTSYLAIDSPVLLPPGKYVACIKIDWRSHKTSSGNCGFGVYGSSYVDIRAAASSQFERFASHLNSSNTLWEQV